MLTKKFTPRALLQQKKSASLAADLGEVVLQLGYFFLNPTFKSRIGGVSAEQAWLKRGFNYFKNKMSLKEQIIANKLTVAVQEALLNITKKEPNVFDSITFDNGSEFSQAASLEDDSSLDLEIYFCHAYSAWERGSNENFNKLLREFIPKGESLHHFTDEEVIEAAQRINQRVREVNDYRSAEEVYQKLKA